jgi:hypothetical protein
VLAAHTILKIIVVQDHHLEHAALAVAQFLSPASRQDRESFREHLRRSNMPLMATSLNREGTNRALVIELAFRAAICVAVTWFLWLGSGAIGLVFAALIWGLLMVKPILELVPMLVREMKRSAWSEWDGDVIVFEIYRLRVRSVAGYPWIVDDDLLAVLGKQGSDAERRRSDPAKRAQLPGTKLWGYSEAGALKYLSSSRHSDAHKLRLVLERQVFLPARKRREA